MPGLGNSKNDYKALAELLTKEGLVVEIAGVNRVDWLRNAAGVVDINYWKGTLNPQPTVNWYDPCCHEHGFTAQTDHSMYAYQAVHAMAA